MTISQKNDELRLSIPFVQKPHRFMMSKGVACLDDDKLLRLIKLFKNFKDFGPHNDPHGEREFINLDLDGEKFFLKIDYFDDDFQYYREDGNRVLLIMFANEY